MESKKEREDFKSTKQSDWSYYEQNLSFCQLKNDDISLEWNEPTISKISDPNIHYRCPKCFNFPKIHFLSNKESIYYTCFNHENKFLNIEKLFIKENKFMTFLDYEELELVQEVSKEKNDDILGFKCVKHRSKKNKYNKFKYYCIICHENICKDCCQKHLKNNHELIVFDYHNFNIQQKINEIKEEIKLEEEKKNALIEVNKKDLEDFNDDDEGKKLNEILLDVDKNDQKEKNSEENKSEKSEKTNLKVIGENIIKDVGGGHNKTIPKETINKIRENFIRLIKIIINDYNKYPNYSHFVNIDHIHNILCGNKRDFIQENSERNNTKSNIKGKAIFLYSGKDILIECEINEKMKDIFERYLSEINLNANEIKFFYDEKEINENLIFENIIKDKDRKEYKMLIHVLEKIIKFKEIICPICKESSLLHLNDYKINLYDCKNLHKTNNIAFKEFERMQENNLSNIECDNCKKIISYGLFYQCQSCNKNLCSCC